jgi:uncharacterized membrane protein
VLGGSEQTAVDAPDAAALCLVGAAALGYGSVNHYRLAHFYPLEWDLAIFEQGLSRLSALEAPLVTVRGLHLFGDHASFVHLLLAPLDALLGPALGPHLLLLVQTAALALSGLLLFGVARRGLPAREARLVLAAYLLSPALQYTWLEYYEPLALAVPALVGAYAAIREERPRAALLWSALALLTMENVALTVAVLGVFAALRGQRRLGALLAVGSGLYVLLLVRVVFPWLNPGGYEYAYRLYGDFATDLPGAVAHLARPDRLLARLATPENGAYLLGLLLPAGFLPVLAPGVLLLAAQLPLNMVSSWPYAHEIRYHYVAPVVPFVYLAAIAALARRPAGALGRRAGLLALAAGTIAGQLLFASPWLVPRGAGWWRGLARDASERIEVGALLAAVPAEASVSAQYRFLPHLARRARLFMFPDLGTDGLPQFVVLDPAGVGDREAEQEALRRVRGGCEEAARTAHGTALFRCGDPGPDAVPLSPASARPAGPPPAPARE